MQLSNVHFSQNFNAIGIDDYCYILQRNQKPFEKYEYVKIRHCLKFRSNSSKNAERQMFEANTVIGTKT